MGFCEKFWDVSYLPLFYSAYLGCGLAGFVVFHAVFNLLNGIRIHFLAAKVDLKEKFGDWAVVTGSTDGIGHAYAHELARRGINIILISRTEEKLKKTAKDIESQHGVQTKIIAVDLSCGKTSIEAVRDQLGDQEVNILVNNVGSLTNFPKSLTETSEEELWSMLNLNVAFTTTMTHLVLSKMVEKGRGAIVNVSSMSEGSPWPLFNIYSATKVFVKYFTEGLQLEYGYSGVTIQLLSPGFVSSKLTDFTPTVQNNIFVAATPEKFSRHAIRTLGVTDSTAGYWLHGVQNYILSWVPVYVRKHVGYLSNKSFRKVYDQRMQKMVTKKINKGL